MEPCQPPSSAGAAGNHRCFAKAQQSAWRLVWAGGQAAAVVEAGFSDPRPSSTTSELSGDLGKTSAAQHPPCLRAHVCGCSRGGTVCIKELSALLPTPRSLLILTTPLGDRLHYFYLRREDTGSEMKSPSKDHKGNKWKRWDLNPTLLALESTANMTILNSDELHRFLYTKTLICQVPKCFLM